MAFLFGRNRQKASSELPRLVKELLPKIDGPSNPKAEELAKLLSQMKLILQGTQGTHSQCSSPHRYTSSLPYPSNTLLTALQSLVPISIQD